jgi:hypothetical protein
MTAYHNSFGTFPGYIHGLKANRIVYIYCQNAQEAYKAQEAFASLAALLDGLGQCL